MGELKKHVHRDETDKLILESNGDLAREKWKLSMGPRITLTCHNIDLIDKALELPNALCKFEVGRGQILKIEKVSEEELNKYRAEYRARKQKEQETFRKALNDHDLH